MNMTFQEAKDKKENIKSPYIDAGIERTVYIVPVKLEDYKDFLVARQEGKIKNDDDCKNYSKDKNFRVISLPSNTDQLDEIEL